MRRNSCPWVFVGPSVMGIALLALIDAHGIAAAEPDEGSARHDQPFVCAQAVLAIDGSESTRDGAFDRQIRAFRAAFESERLYRAIQDCLPGSVAFAVSTWSGAAEQDLCLDWLVVMNDDEGQHVQALFERCHYFGGTTDIGRAVEHGLQILENSPFASYYRIILVLTNGRTDRGAEGSLSAARAQAAAAGVTIAAYAMLPSQSKSPNPFFMPDAVPLESYVADQVSAGPRAFWTYSRPEDDVETLLGALVEMLRQEAS